MNIFNHKISILKDRISNLKDKFNKNEELSLEELNEVEKIHNFAKYRGVIEYYRYFNKNRDKFISYIMASDDSLDKAHALDLMLPLWAYLDTLSDSEISDLAIACLG